MKVYNYDPRTGLLTGSSAADPDQLTPGEFLDPAFSSREEPPEPGPGERVRWTGGTWALEDVPQERPAPPPPVPPPAPVVDVVETRMAEAAKMLDDMAKAFGYFSTADAVSYADEPAVPKYQREGRQLRRWRSMLYLAAETGEPFPELLEAAEPPAQ